MSWSEPAFRDRCLARIAEMGKSARKLFVEHGLGHDTLDKVPAAGRRIDTLVKIGEALNWSLAEVLGFGVQHRISIRLATKGFAAAGRILQYLPPDAQTDDTQVRLFAYIYDALMGRQRDGRPMDDQSVAEAIAAYEQILIATWLEKASSAGPSS